MQLAKAKIAGLLFTEPSLSMSYTDGLCTPWSILLPDIFQVWNCRVRTSSGTFLARGQDKIIQGIEKRIADFTFIPLGKSKANMSMDFSKYCGVCAQQGVELV